MKRLGLRLFLVAAAGLWATSAWANPSVRTSVSLTGGELRISDLFVNAPSDAVIGAAPAPGRRQVFDRFALQRIARSHGLKWRPANPFIQSVVTRESRVMEQKEIEDLLWRAAVDRGMPKDRKLELISRGISIHVATNLRTPYRIETFDYDKHTGRATGVLAVATDSEDMMRYRLDGATYSVVEVPVLANRVRRGDEIQPGDVIWKEYRRDAVGRNMIVDRDAVVGQAARRFLSPGQPLMMGDLEPPKLVRKGSIVTVYFSIGNLRLTAKARAVEDGALQDTIKVVNVRSNRTIEAVVHSATKLVIPSETTVTN